MDQALGTQHAVDSPSVTDVVAATESVSAPQEEVVLLPSADGEVLQPTEDEVPDSNNVASEEWPPFVRLLSVSPCDIEWISMFYKYVHTFYIFYTLINIYCHFLFKSHIFSQYHCFHSLASPIHFTHVGFSSTFLYFFSKNSVWW